MACLMIIAKSAKYQTYNMPCLVTILPGFSVASSALHSGELYVLIRDSISLANGFLARSLPPIMAKDMAWCGKVTSLADCK